MRPESLHAVDCSEEVSDAFAAGRAVVALESTIIAHGMPWPQNLETARRVEQVVRSRGAVPATIAILGGQLRAGLTDDELEAVARKGTAMTKASRRDLPFIVARKEDGATTVATTLMAAALAGIRVMATGGIGGVHRGVEDTMDISADLRELAGSDLAVVCAGIKSVLDIGRTLELLETLGVPVAGYRTDTVPAFYSRDSGFPVDYRVEEAAEIAAVLRAKRDCGIGGAVLVTNPVPAEFALDEQEIEAVIEQAIADMDRDGVTGKETTPYLLARIAEVTGGSSLAANIELVVNNALLAADIAVADSEAATA